MLRIALTVVIALVAMAGIGWLFIKPDERPPCCTENATVSDPATGFEYALPEGWIPFRDGEFIHDFNTGARTETEQPGAQVWTFTMKDWSGDPQASAEEAARATTGFFYAAVPEEWEFLSSKPRTINGIQAYEVSWTAFHPHFEEPIYGRLLQVPTPDGRSANFLFAFAFPDDKALRDEIDWIFATAHQH